MYINLSDPIPLKFPLILWFLWLIFKKCYRYKEIICIRKLFAQSFLPFKTVFPLKISVLIYDINGFKFMYIPNDNKQNCSLCLLRFFLVFNISLKRGLNKIQIIQTWTLLARNVLTWKNNFDLKWQHTTTNR